MSSITNLLFPMFLGVAEAWVPRESVNLNGTWEFVRVKSLDEHPPAEGWKKIEVPGCITGWNYEYAWFRRSFEVPSAWQGKRVKLLLRGARFCPVVYVNGKKVGEHFGGYEPAEFDITLPLRYGKENQLLIRVHDWTSVFIAGDRLELKGGWFDIRGIPKQRVIYPIGGRYNEFGLWDDVVIYPVPAEHISAVFIRTDVSKREISLHYEITNESERQTEAVISARVLEGEKQILVFAPKKVSLSPGETKKVVLSSTWRPGQVTLWSPENPKLYMLESSLQGPNYVDKRKDRFGFRQFTIKGHNFYLNGVKRRLLATSAWPLPAKTRDEIANVLRTIKQANCIAFRTHTQPWRRIWYDVADEVGLLMIPEGAVWCDTWTYRLEDPEFWENFARHLRSMVRSLYNHPSIIMWSLENELVAVGGERGIAYEKQLADLGRMVKQEDPTRPITYESDGDPGGVADVIGLHYPRDPPHYRLWPNEAYWMDKPVKVPHTICWPEPEFKWNRLKPLYIGEYIHWFGGTTPAVYTLICGDDAYRDIFRFRQLAKAEVWRWQTIAYRHYEVSGLCPWTMFEGGPLKFEENPLMVAQAYAMQPLAAYVREETRRGYSGKRIRRHLEIFNDLPNHIKATLVWELVAGEQILEKGKISLDLEPGDHEDRAIEFVTPPVKTVTQSVLRVSIQKDKVIAFTDERPFTIFPSPPRLQQPLAPLYVYDPVGATKKLLTTQGLKVQSINSLDNLELTPGSILLIGENALQMLPEKSAWAVWQKGEVLRHFVTFGGRIIVLQQKVYPTGMLPVELNPKALSTIAFVRQLPDHPLTQGLPEDAAKFWQPDHLVTNGEIVRPVIGGCLPLVVTGHPDGISHCALLEVRRGKGLYLLCQMPVVSRFNDEPMAAEFFNRLLSWAALYKAKQSEVVVVGGDENYHNALEDIQLRYRSCRLDAENLKTAEIVLARGENVSSFQELIKWVGNGGRLLLDCPSPKLVAEIGKAVGLELRVDPYSGPPLRTEENDLFIQSILREDLYWVAKPPPFHYWDSPLPLAFNVAEGALVLGTPADFKPITTITVDKIQLEGAMVRRQDDYIAMFSPGTGKARFTVPVDGHYFISVEARGTPCKGVYAQGLVSVDGEKIGMVNTTAEWRRVVNRAYLKAGEHEVTVRFINDAWAPPEDRNFYLRSIAIGLVPDDYPEIVPIADGPCVAYLSLGRGLVVVNFLRWDAAEEQNIVKAKRFFASLLTAMDAEFIDKPGVSYSFGDFKPMPNFSGYRSEAGCAYLYSAGWIEGEIEIPKSGNYLLRIEASGRKAAGEYPEVVVWLNNKEIATFNLTTQAWRDYLIRLPMQAGKHILRVAFTNDYYKPPEDRNLFLRRLVISPAE